MGGAYRHLFGESGGKLHGSWTIIQMGREVTREMQLSDPEPKFLNGTSK